MNAEYSSPDFEDIRPFRDDEITTVVTRLVDNHELIDTLARMKFPRLMARLPQCLRPLIHKVIHRVLRREFGYLSTVKQCQELIGEHLASLLERVAEGVTVTGLDKLDVHRSYVFISNHRDIAMDPAMVNLAMHRQNRDTTRIAIGDNLLSKPFVSDLMRLNKSFIVKRSATARREKLAALKELSAYIHHSLDVDQQSIWIAQREGRAKDGLDSTETALLKMLVLNKSRDQSFGEAFNKLHIVPVAISYEWDPCDAVKAQELYALQTEGSYIKADHEDIDSIYRGIIGEKGHIEVAFGEELAGPFDDANAAAAAIDKQIIANYRLQASHLVAFEELHGDSPEIALWKQALGQIDWQVRRAGMLARLAEIPLEHRKIMLSTYANPVQARLEASR